MARMTAARLRRPTRASVVSAADVLQKPGALEGLARVVRNYLASDAAGRNAIERYADAVVTARASGPEQRQ